MSSPNSNPSVRCSTNQESGQQRHVTQQPSQSSRVHQTKPQTKFPFSTPDHSFLASTNHCPPSIISTSLPDLAEPSIQPKTTSKESIAERLESVSFLVNHSAHLASTNAPLFQRSLKFVLDPLLHANPPPIASSVCLPPRDDDNWIDNNLSCDFGPSGSASLCCTANTTANHLGGEELVSAQFSAPGSSQVPRHVNKRNGARIDLTCEDEFLDVAPIGGIQNTSFSMTNHFNSGKGSAVQPSSVSGSVERRHVTKHNPPHQNSFSFDCSIVQPTSLGGSQSKKQKTGLQPPRFEIVSGRDECFTQKGKIVLFTLSYRSFITFFFMFRS